MLIDSHCHLDDDRFDQDRDQVLARARAAGINQIIVPATTAIRWQKIQRVCEDHDGLYAAYGLHPMFMPEHKDGDILALEHWLDQHPAIALGECGLDFFVSHSDEKEQIELFRTQLGIALNHRLPVIIHARNALDKVIHEIRSSSLRRGVIHSFSGSLQQAQQLADLGFKLGIAATVGFERAKKLRRVVSEVEIEALLIETDAPDQPGTHHRGQRNEPAFMLDHLTVMAGLRNMPEHELSTIMNQNCRQLFTLVG